MTTSGRLTQPLFDDGSPTHGLLPTPSKQEPGLDAERIVDRDGNPPAHWNQRLYDKVTGRLVQDGLPQVVAMFGSTLSAAASPVNPSPSPASSAANMTPAISGLPLLDWLPTSGPLGSLLRTCLGSSAWRSTICSLTWTVSATPRGRWLFRLRASARSTGERGSGLSLIGTPTAAMKHRSAEHADGRAPNPKELANMAARMWPTPNVPNGGRVLPEGTSPTGMTPDGKKRQVGLENAVGGKLNPDFVLRLMGFPDGWLDLDS